MNKILEKYYNISLYHNHKIHRAWYQLDKDLFSKDKISNEGLWIKGALSFCIQTGNFCNFLCPFCLSDSGPDGISKSDWIEQALINLNDITGPVRIIWAGGEPTLLTDLDRLLEISKSFGNINVVTTNGSVTISTPNVEWIDFSIYGTDQRSYEEMTGRNLFNKVWTNLEKVLNDGKRVSINSILNLNSTIKVIRVIEKCYSIGVKRFKLHRPLPLGRNKQQIPEVETQRAISEIRNIVPDDLIVSYPLTTNYHEMLSAYWVINSPGIISNNLIKLSLNDQKNIKKEIAKNLDNHYKIFLEF